MIALRRDEPHWLLSDADARVYGQALQNALRHIPIRRAQKAVDFAMLVFAAAQFDIPRIYMSSQIAKQRLNPQRGSVVYPFRAQPPPPPPPAGAPNPPSTAGGVSNGGGVNGASAAGLDMSIEPESVEPRFGPM